MAESVFGKKSVGQKVRDEIEARSTSQGLLWSAKRFPWISIKSLSAEEGAYAILTSRTTDKLYWVDGSGRSVRPKPAVTGVAVKKQGELGTTRKATISITCFDDIQLEELQKSFLIPGVGCRVEWGWNQDCSGNQSPGPVGNPLTDPDAQVIADIRKQADTSTAYDGLQGIIANFSFNLTKSNTWECSVEVIAAAEAFSRASAIVQPDNCNTCARSYTGPDKKETIQSRSLLYTFLMDCFTDIERAQRIYQPALERVAKMDDNGTTISEFRYPGVDRDQNGGEESGFWNGVQSVFASIFGTEETPEVYISWPTFEAAINLFAIPTTKQGEYSIGRLASPMDTKISYNSWLMSSDPRVCLLLGNQKTYFSFQGIERSGGDSHELVPPQPRSICLNHIMVNVIYLMSVVRDLENGDSEQMSIHNLVTTVLNRINGVCGDMWDFQLINRTDVQSLRGPVLAVVDSKDYEADTVLVIPANPADSVVRDLKLEMKMTEQMKSQALFANGVQQATTTVGKGGCGANGFRLFGINTARSLNKAAPKAEKPPECHCDEGSKEAEKELTLFEWLNKLSEAVDDNNVSGLRNALIKKYAEYIKTGDDAHCKGMILPFEFGITLDGIGGFKFGQMITCNRIPSQVRDNYDWQVTTVEHNITVNDWTTTINTVCRFKA